MRVNDAADEFDEIGDKPTGMSLTKTPYCQVHYCEMKVYSKHGEKSYCECPVDDCDERKSMVRGDLRVPARPSVCPCDGCGKSLEAKTYKAFFVLMACPDAAGCGFEIQLPRADIAERGKLKRRGTG